MSALRVGIVGGSLAGCAMAATLSSAGCEVTVFERSGEEAMRDRGSGIGFPRDLVATMRRRGLFDGDMPTEWIERKLWIRADRNRPERGEEVWVQEPFNVSGNNWNVVWDNLRRRVPEGSYRARTEVVAVQAEDDGVEVELSGGRRQRFDLLVGADGNRSRLRWRNFDVAQDYTGYVLWRGWYDGAEVPDEESIAGALSTVVFEQGHFNCWLVPAPTGSPPGSRQLAWILYDTLAGAPFVEAMRDADGSLRQVPQGGCTPEQVDYVHELARRELPDYYADLVLRDPRPLIAPLYDIRLSSYRSGRLVVAGDAGTTVTPMTGSGATKGIGDALELADAILEEPDLEAALARYDLVRPAVGAGLADMGRRIGELMVDHPPDWAAMDQAGIEAAWNGMLSDTPFFYQSQD